MLKKTITYTDYNGIERTEDFLFNLTKTELMKWDLKTPGGLGPKLEKITQKFDVPSLTNFIEALIDKSYGIKSDDGVRFIKDEKLSEMFRQTEAYDQLFVELLSDEKKTVEFINGILPKELMDEVKKQNETASRPNLLSSSN
jgi:hypothetical protein